MIQRFNRLLDSLSNHERLLGTLLLLRLPLLLVGTDIHKELSDLVSILAGCWHFDRACPVEVEVAQRVRQVL